MANDNHLSSVTCYNVRGLSQGIYSESFLWRTTGIPYILFQKNGSCTDFCMERLKDLKEKGRRPQLKKKAANLFPKVYFVYPKTGNELENLLIERTPTKMQCLKNIDFCGSS